MAGPGLPPPARPRRRGLIVGIVIAAIVIVLGGGGTVAALELTKSVPPATVALKASQAIAQARGVGLTGTIGGGAANLTVTRAGTVEGSYTQGGNQVSRITIQGNTYLKAPTAFWKAIAVVTSPSQANGKWAWAPDEAINMNFAAFTPAQLSRALSDVRQHPTYTQTTLGGTKVLRFTAGTSTFDVADASPYRLLRITGRSHSTPYTFTVNALNATAIQPVFTQLTSQVKDLASVVDPTAAVTPTQKISFASNCKNDTGCTVTIKDTLVTLAQADMVTMTADFSATSSGKAFGSCRQEVTVEAFDTVTQSCELNGPVWHNWFDSHNGNFTTWATPHFQTAINSATDIQAMEGELTGEQSAA